LGNFPHSWFLIAVFSPRWQYRLPVTPLLQVLRVNVPLNRQRTHFWRTALHDMQILIPALGTPGYELFYSRPFRSFPHAPFWPCLGLRLFCGGSGSLSFPLLFLCPFRGRWVGPAARFSPPPPADGGLRGARLYLFQAGALFRISLIAVLLPGHSTELALTSPCFF